MILDDDKNKILIKKKPCCCSKLNKDYCDRISSFVRGLECLEAGREFRIPGAGPKLRILKVLRNEGNAFAREMA